MIYKVKTAQLLFLFFSIININAQVNEKSDLFNTLKAKDSLLFEIGFNECNQKIMKKLVTDDIEFYHDKDGITKSKTQFLNSIKENLCGSGKNIIKRILDKTSLEVFPLYQDGKLYGALQNGIHSFQQTKASFSHIWILENGEWKLSRVISYNHHQEKQVLKSNFVDVSVNELKRYVGVYEFSPEFILEIRIKDGQLFGGSQGQEVVIRCYDEHKFIDSEQVHDLEFILDKKGIVTNLYMKGSGMEMTASKKK